MRQSPIRIAACLAATALAAALAPPAAAEVSKSMAACGDHQFCASYRVALHVPEGWAVDAAASAERGAQILVPKGTSFDSAPALIYVQVFYVPDKSVTLAAFAADSNSRWQARAPGANISPRPDVARASGAPAFLAFAYDNAGKQGQAYELGAFAPDKDADGNAFVIDAVVSGNDKAAVDHAAPAYLAVLKGL